MRIRVRSSWSWRRLGSDGKGASAAAARAIFRRVFHGQPARMVQRSASDRCEDAHHYEEFFRTATPQLNFSRVRPACDPSSPRSRHRPLASTDGSATRNPNKTGVRLWTAYAGQMVKNPVASSTRDWAVNVGNS